MGYPTAYRKGARRLGVARLSQAVPKPAPTPAPYTPPPWTPGPPDNDNVPRPYRPLPKGKGPFGKRPIIPKIGKLAPRVPIGVLPWELLGLVPVIIPWTTSETTVYPAGSYSLCCGIEPYSINYDDGTFFFSRTSGACVTCGLAGQALAGPEFGDPGSAAASNPSNVAIQMADKRITLTTRYYVRGAWVRPVGTPHLPAPFIAPRIQPIPELVPEPSIRPSPYPEQLPIQRPVPTPRPWPIFNPNLPPVRQPGTNPYNPNPRGYEVPGPNPWEIGSPEPLPWQNPTPKKPPPPEEIEHKIKGKKGLLALLLLAAKILDDLRFTEGILDAIWDALPAEVRKAFGGKQASNLDKLEAVYKHWGEWDVDKALWGILENWSGEKFGGKMIERQRNEIAKMLHDWKMRYRTYSWDVDGEGWDLDVGDPPWLTDDNDEGN